MAILTPRHSNFKSIHTKYIVSGGHGAAKTDTLAEAKKAGDAIAKKEAWRGKWNVPFISVSIHKQDARGSIFYGESVLTKYVPVRGSGARAEQIIAEIKKRHGVAPFVWTKRWTKK